MRLLCATICVILGICVADYIDINACFVQRPGFEVSVRVNQVENTKTVQFKDDCLRECLKTLQDDTRRCRSIIHMPRDNDCIISDSLGQSVGRVGSTKVHNNYYENVCAQDPHVHDAFQKPAGISLQHLDIALKLTSSQLHINHSNFLCSFSHYNLHTNYCS